ncbi:nucleoside phosphatase GDA1/CD39, partial [Chytriomyces sp. MP71]
WYVDRHYGIVIDAGSSGSRLLIYSWKSSNNPVHNATSLPLIEKAFPDDRKPWSKAIEPGISSLATQRLGTLPTLKSVRKYLKPLLGFAAKSIPRHLHASTPVYLLATAGMRLVPQEAQDRILQYSCETVRKYYRFDLSGGCARQFRIISGEAEGIFGWVAVNYLHGGFEEPRLQRPPPREGSPSTYGFLDMGGASMQIAFEPRESMKMSHEQDLTRFTLRTAGGHNIHHEIFVTSFLGFGVNEARRRYLEGIALEADETTPAPPLLQDPCLPHNLQIPPDRYTHRLRDPKPTLVGTGDLRRCLALVTPYLRKEAPCSHEPCLFNGVAAPITDFAQHRFIGVSEYYYTPRAVQGGAGAYHFDEFVGNAEGICGSAWEELRGHAGRLDAVEEGRLKLRCFKSAWVLEVLHDGFGIPRQETIGARGGGEAFEPAKELNGFPISWTMGAMLFHVSSTIPPSGGGKGGSGVLARDTPKL